MIPLFFLNIKNSHDWGGDFAQYIHQAINIYKGIPMSETGYIFNDQYPLAPRLYPPGFSLLLVPVYAVAGNSIIAFSYFVTALLFLFGIGLYYFIRGKSGIGIAMASVIIIVYNPWTLRFKTEILSDIPFALFLMLVVVLYEKLRKQPGSLILPILIGLLSGFLMLIRSIGIFVLVAIFADYLLEVFRSKYAKEKVSAWKSTLVIILSATVLYLVFMKIIFWKDSEVYIFYSSLFSFSALKLLLLHNSEYYVQNFQRFFNPDVGIYNVVPLIIKAFALSFFLIGLIFKILRNAGFVEIVCVLYIAIILLFPNLTQGIRYIFPVFPFIIYYIIVGLKSLKPETTIKPAVFGIILVIFSVIQYEPGIQKIIKERNVIIQGPQEPEAKEAFRIITELTPVDARIAFIKPTVLSLYSQRSSIANHFAQDSKSLDQKLTDERISYFLLCSDLPNQVLQKYINENQNEIILIWKNAKFELYSRIISQ